LGGLVKATLTLDVGTSCDVYLQGAHVTSFKNEHKEEVLFVSSKSNFAPNKPIRGGIPVIFPQFGPGKLKQHGFLRDSSEWKIMDAGIKKDQTVQSCWISLVHKATEATLQLWPHHFSFKITISITYDSVQGSQLYQEVEVINLNQTECFNFTFALHTYFSISSIHDTSVSNLQNISYFDKVTQTNQVQTTPEYTFSGETDKIFYKAPDQLTIHSHNNKSLTLFKTNFPDVVVWNIWEDRIKSMSDLAPDDWKNYVCVESGNIGTGIRLSPHQIWTGLHHFGSFK